MTEFKKGDRVVFTKDDAWWERGELVARMPAGTLGTYLGTDDDAPDEGAPWVRLDTGEHVLAWADVLAPVEDHGTGDGSASDICAEPGCNCDLERRFPAPLDPSKVKPGDTVTVTDGKAIITGVVDSVRERAAQLWFRFRFGEQADAYFEVPLSDRFGEAFNLTAHAPAPEPEPEPSGFGTAVVAGEPERVRGFVSDSGFFWSPDVQSPLSGREFADFRPLVVLDPESDTDRLWNIIREVDGNHDLGAGALAEAILERLNR